MPEILRETRNLNDGSGSAEIIMEEDGATTVFNWVRDTKGKTMMSENGSEPVEVAGLMMMPEDA